MASTNSFTINVDGAARGNPGPAAFAFVMHSDGKFHSEEAGLLGSATNNVAEYTALLRALERAAELGATDLFIRSDSELLVKQMKGEYKVKNLQLQGLYNQAKALCRQFESVRLVHIPRSENSHADRLCNEALDGARTKEASPSRSPKSRAQRKLAQEDALREDALTWLRWAAAQWGAGNAGSPTPEDVWDHLWTIMEDHGVVRAKP
jgi:ribonuclease HI